VELDIVAWPVPAAEGGEGGADKADTYCMLIGPLVVIDKTPWEVISVLGSGGTKVPIIKGNSGLKQGPMIFE
jgi:hypothetical protein